MEHIVQFGITVDDEEIKRRISDNAYDDVVNKLAEFASNYIKPRNYYYGYNDGLNVYLDGAIGKFIEENKEEILNRVTDKIVNKVYRSKVFSQRINGLLTEMEAENGEE